MIATLRKALLVGMEEADGFVKKRLFLVLFLILLTSVSAACAPLALKYAVDGFESGQWAVLETGAMGGAVVLGPVLLVLGYIFFLWLSRFCGELRWFFYGTADQRLHRKISRRLFSHVLRLPMSFHMERKTGALNQTVVQGVTGYSILLNNMVFTILPVFIELLLMSVIVAMFLSPLFLLVLLGSVLAYLGVFFLGMVQIHGPSQKVSERQLAAYASLTDSILNSETVKYFTAEDHLSDRYDGSLAEAESGWAEFYWSKTQNGLLVSLVFAVTLGGALLLAVIQTRNGAMSVGGFVMINAYMLQIIRPIEMLGTAFRSIVQGIAFIEKLLDVLDKETENYTRTGTIPLSVNTATRPAVLDHDQDDELVFDQVCFTYPVAGEAGSRAPRKTLDKISFTLKRGQKLAIVGPSGAGKSSVIRLLLRFFMPDSGGIYLRGTPLSQIPLSELRERIAVVPQDTVLFNDTLAYNIGFGKLNGHKTEIEEAARCAHLDKTIAMMPEGYQTIVGERGVRLSGGERQRVSIARASLKKPDIYVFDEATSSLDTTTEREILRNLEEVSRGATTLVIAHRLSTVQQADQILVLENGRIIEAGTHDTLLQREGAYAAMWNNQKLRKNGFAKNALPRDNENTVHEGA